MSDLFARKGIVYCDGASRGNPGASGWGAVLYDAATKSVIAEGCGPLGITTNNVAEYTAALEGIRIALQHGITELELRADSQLLVRQLTGEYKIKAEHLKPLAAEARGLLAQFTRWRATHVPREQNRHADALSNRGADQVR